MKNTIRKRVETEANYSAVFLNGKTLRIPLDSKKPITELEYPEFYDISLGNRCVTGRCPWCYAKGNPNGKHYTNIVQKINNYFGKMDDNQLPFQVCLGGQQDPLEHPDIWEVCREFQKFGIVPNITSNGVLVTDEVCELVNKYCGGIAISWYEHLNPMADEAIELALKHNIKTNMHYIISDEQSVDKVSELYNKYKGRVDYFVLLPYMNVGYAAKNPKTIAYDKLETWLDSITTLNDIAFGANFHNFLVKTKKWDVSLYPPEIMSKYLVMDDNMDLYNNSFEMKLVSKGTPNI